MIKIIAAVDNNYLIGNQNKIPWNIPEEMKFFKSETINNVVVMGRNTWESLPYKPLKDRINCVISNNVAYKAPFIRTFTCISDVVKWYRLLYSSVHLWVIGGQQIYKNFLELDVVDQIVLSHIPNSYEGNIYFPHEYLEKYEVIHEEDKNTFIVKTYGRKK